MTGPSFTPAPEPASWAYSIAANGRSVATYNGDTAVQGSAGVLLTGFATLAAFQAANIAPGTPLVQTNGYYTAGDGGACQYVPGTSAIWQVTSADGQTWVVAPFYEITPQCFGAIGNGVAGNASLDTAGVQTAFNLENTVRLQGILMINATLTLNSTNADSGTIIRGIETANAAGGGVLSSCLRPLAGVNPVINVGLSSGSVYVQSIEMRDFVIDMVNIADVATNVGINYGYGFDHALRNVRWINDGSLKRSLQFSDGCYDTMVTNCQFGRVYFNGVSNLPAVIGFLNCDINGLAGGNAGNVWFQGGSIQVVYASSNVVYQAAGLGIGAGLYGYPQNTTGLYYNQMVVLGNFTTISFTNIDLEPLGSVPATYNDGTHGTLTLVSTFTVGATARNVSFSGSRFSGCYLRDLGGINVVADQYQNNVEPPYDTRPKGMGFANAIGGAPNLVAAYTNQIVTLGGTWNNFDTYNVALDTTSQKFLILTPGTYMVGGSCGVDSGFTNGSVLQSQIITNISSATSTWQGATGYGVSNTAYAPVGAMVFKLNPGDYVSLKAFNNSASSAQLGQDSTYLTVVKIG